MFHLTAKVIHVFDLLCFIATFSMIGYWAHEYFRNEDLSVIHFDYFNYSHQTYPVVSFCFCPPFLENELRNFNISISMYQDYLKGEADGERFRNITYDNVTIDIRNFIGRSVVYWKNGSKYEQYPSTIRKVINIDVSYGGFINGAIHKCFGFEIRREYVQAVKKVKIRLNTSIFDMYPGKQRPSDGRFSTRLHYPNQFLLAYQNIKWGWPERTNYHPYYMRFTIKMMEVLRRRRKIRSPCISENEPFDVSILRQTTAVSGCRAPYQIQNSFVPECLNKKNIKDSFFDEAKFEPEKYNPPCEEMLQLVDVYNELDMTKHVQSYFGVIPNHHFIGIIYPNRVKVIEQAREISFHSLIGNCGGYIGLFLGNQREEN